MILITILKKLSTKIREDIQIKIYKGPVMQVEKALIDDRLRVSKVSWKSHIPTIYNFAVIYAWIFLFS